MSKPDTTRLSMPPASDALRPLIEANRWAGKLPRAEFEHVLALIHKNSQPLIEVRDRLKADITALQAFKDYVHGRLDEAGIPTHPDGEHSKAGCRIGDRLDIGLAGHAEAARLRRVYRPQWFYDPDSMETCCFDVSEVIDSMDLPEGKHVVEVSAAATCPSIWCAVTVDHGEDSDEPLKIDEFETKEAAEQALKGPNT